MPPADEVLLSPAFSPSLTPLPLFLDLVDRRLGDPAHGVMGFLLGGHAHVDEQGEPPCFVVVQTVFRWASHLVLLSTAVPSHCSASDGHPWSDGIDTQQKAAK
jgi:hypothetical protein